MNISTSYVHVNINDGYCILTNVCVYSYKYISNKG